MILSLNAAASWGGCSASESMIYSRSLLSGAQLGSDLCPFLALRRSSCLGSFFSNVPTMLHFMVLSRSYSRASLRSINNYVVCVKLDWFSIFYALVHEIMMVLLDQEPQSSHFSTAGSQTGPILLTICSLRSVILLGSGVHASTCILLR